MSDLAKETILKAQTDLLAAKDLVHRAMRTIEAQPIHADDAVAEIFSICKDVDYKLSILNKQIAAFLV